MAKKENILELLNAYKSEVDNFNDAIFTDKFEVLSQDIVKLFAIPVVVVPKGTLCDNLDIDNECKNMCLTRCVNGHEFWK
jgi:hypothetical protein